MDALDIAIIFLFLLGGVFFVAWLGNKLFRSNLKSGIPTSLIAPGLYFDGIYHHLDHAPIRAAKSRKKAGPSEKSNGDTNKVVRKTRTKVAAVHSIAKEAAPAPRRRTKITTMPA